MKTRIATLMFIVSMFFFATAYANEPVPASKAVAQSVAKNIQQELEYPEFAIKDKFECCVMVSIIIQEDGRYDVDCINCVSSQVKKYVEYEIEHMKFKEHAKYAGQSVLVKIKFDLKVV